MRRAITTHQGKFCASIPAGVQLFGLVSGSYRVSRARGTLTLNYAGQTVETLAKIIEPAECKDNLVMRLF